MEYKNSIYSLYYDWWKNIDKFIFSLIEDNTKIIIRPKITKDKCLKKNA